MRTSRYNHPVIPPFRIPDLATPETIHSGPKSKTPTLSRASSRAPKGLSLEACGRFQRVSVIRTNFAPLRSFLVSSHRSGLLFFPHIDLRSLCVADRSVFFGELREPGPSHAAMPFARPNRLNLFWIPLLRLKDRDLYLFTLPTFLVRSKGVWGRIGTFCSNLRKAKFERHLLF